MTPHPKDSGQSRGFLMREHITNRSKPGVALVMVGGGQGRQGEAGAVGLAQTEMRRLRGIQQHLPLPKELLEALGLDPA